MAKKTKNIGDLQNALLSNTKFLKKSKKENPNQKKEEEISEIIPSDLFEKYKELAEKHNLDLQGLITTALEHFIDLEEYWFDNNEKNKEI